MSNIITVFESSMLVRKDARLIKYFPSALLNHIIQFESEDGDDPDVESERLIYRVVIEKVK